jgi:hypothetical protein
MIVEVVEEGIEAVEVVRPSYVCCIFVWIAAGF